MKSETVSRQKVTNLCLVGMLAIRVHAAPGGWDQSYAPTITGGPVYTITLQPDGRLLVGGLFTSVNGSSSRSRLARLFPDGTLDPTFLTNGIGVSGTVYSLALQTDGRIVIGGDFTSVNGTARTRVARLNVNGTVDGSFVPTNTISGSVLAVAAQTNNAVIVGGSFNITGFPSWNARLNADGTVDTAFSSFPNGAVNAIAIQPDGKIVIGGAFTSLNGATRNRIARLNADGSLDNTFANGLSGASATVRCLQIQSDGKILIGGDFTTVNGTSRTYVARLNSNGSLDNGFGTTSGLNGAVYALAQQPDSSVVVAGGFSAYANFSLSRVARLYADGTRDPSFSIAGMNNIAQALAVQNDGALVVGGTFTTINNTNRQYLGRLYGNLYPPEFITQPQNRATNVGATVTFSALVNNPTPAGYQWRKDGNNISGAVGTAYTLYNVQFGDVGNYSVFVSNGAGGTTSSNALLQVGIAPVITQHPVSLAVTQGESATFTAAATGTPLNYFWRKNGALIPGATNATLGFASTVFTNGGTYTCLVSNFVGSALSTGAVLTIAAPPEILVPPVGLPVAVSNDFTLTVTTIGTAPLAYQWLKDGDALAGMTNSSFAITNAQTNDAGDFSVVVSNLFGSVTSAPATVIVGYAPVVTQHPQAVTSNLGTSNAFNVAVFGSDPLVYQWFKDGMAILDATNSLLPLSNLQSNQAGYYLVTVTNAYGWAISSNALLTIPDIPLPSLLDGLVAYYPLDGNANDFSGNSNNLVLSTGTLVFTNDQFGAMPAALYCDYTRLDTQSETGMPTGTNDFTISVWGILDGRIGFTEGTANPDPHRVVFANQLINGCQISLYDTEGGNPIPEFLVGGFAAFGASTAQPRILFPKLVWHHVVGVRNGYMLQMFVDGLLVASGTNNHQITSAAASRKLSFGRRNNGDHAWTGNLDAIRIYNRALSPVEVQRLYAGDLQSGMRLEAVNTTNGLSLRFPTAANLNYSVLYTTNLTAGPWQKFVDVLAQPTNNIAEVIDPAVTNSLQRFYRLVTPPVPD